MVSIAVSIVVIGQSFIAPMTLQLGGFAGCAAARDPYSVCVDTAARATLRDHREPLLARPESD